MEKRINDIKRRFDLVKGGNWAASEIRHGYDQIIRDKNYDPVCSVFRAGYPAKEANANANFIAHSYEDIKYLLEVLKK